MKLTAGSSSFQLTILGYQFPDAEGEQYDANWLIVRVDVESPRGSWKATDTCLLTYEAAQLAEWIEKVAQGEPVQPGMKFLEPALLFRFIRYALMGFWGGAGAPWVFVKLGLAPGRGQPQAA